MPPTHLMEGIESAHAFRAAHPSTGVVVLSQHTDEAYALALFEGGSAGVGYLLKDRIGDLEDLVHALREVCAGGSVVDPQIVDALVRRRSRGVASPLAALSPRELAHGIHPQVLSDNGLVAAVESRTTRFPIDQTIEADEAVRAQRFAADVETVAFYTIREALANVVKHADASRAGVSMTLTPTGLRVDVTDDGIGFDPASPASSPAERTGLANIRDRVAAIGGHVHLDSSPRRGTHLVVELPLEERPDTTPERPTAPAPIEPARA
jgi:hypothetical protein